ncbi:MAG TPA: ABC transporter substrate-binding protein [bacterium]|nr:ABC transporter substrate-binding protein [bacterium]
MDNMKRVDRLAEQYYLGGITRREFVRRALTMGVSAAALSGAVVDLLAGAGQAAPPMKGTGEVVVCTWGGSYANAQKTAFFDPFEQETGIKVRIVGVPDVAKIQAMVQTGNVEWDLVDSEGEMMIELGRKGMLERADYSIINKADLIAGTSSDWGIGSVAYAYVLAWNTTKFPAGRAPATWADFFNDGRFPGHRAMYNQPIPVLEFALLADGVSRDKLYPLDVDRAYKFLQPRKAEINVWYKDTNQITTLMRGGDVDLIEATSGRVLELQRSHSPAAFTWNQAAWMQSYWITPKGAKNKVNAMKLMAYYARPANEAKFVETFPYGVPNAKAYGLMPPATAAMLPTNPANVGKEIQVNSTWWADNGDAMTKRWLAFVNG